jgi:hypothetical protein
MSSYPRLVRVLEWIAIIGILLATALTGLNVYPLNVIVSVTSESIYVVAATLERRVPMIVLNLGMITLLVIGVVVKHYS